MKQERRGQKTQACAEEWWQLPIAEADRDLVRPSQQHDEHECREDYGAWPSHNARLSPWIPCGRPHSSGNGALNSHLRARGFTPSESFDRGMSHLNCRRQNFMRVALIGVESLA